MILFIRTHETRALPPPQACSRTPKLSEKQPEPVGSCTLLPLRATHMSQALLLDRWSPQTWGCLKRAQDKH